MRVVHELKARVRALEEALASEREPSRAAEEALNFAVLDIARLAQGDAPAEIHCDARGTRWQQACNQWRSWVTSKPFSRWLDRRCASMGAEDDRAFYAVELAIVHAGEQGLRKRCGIYYTPRPLVDYLVRSAEYLLIHRLGFSQGFCAAGPSEMAPTIVDPACGSGLFLDTVSRSADSQQGTSNLGATSRTRPPLIGFEVVPAVAAAAEFVMRERYGDDLPLRIVPQSALEQTSVGLIDEVRNASDALVVLGNPPYANFGGANRNPWMLDLLSTYRADLDERKHNVHDDALKFLRWAEWQIERVGRGVIALVLNHAFLEGLTHRAVRASLQRTFQHLYVLDLHGSALRKNQSDGHSIDENVFGIRPGIALCLAVRDGTDDTCQVHYQQLRGPRHEKLAWLSDHNVATTRWVTVESAAPLWRLVPSTTATEQQRTYARWPALNAVFDQYLSGVQTKNDELFVDFSYATLERRMRAWLMQTGAAAFDPARMLPYMVAPWDLRWVYYDPRLLGRARYRVMQSLLAGSLGLVFMRQSTNAVYDHFLVTRTLVSDRVFYSGHGAPYLAPLYMYDVSGPVSNLNAEFMRAFAERIELPSGNADVPPLDVLAYVYAFVHAPRYRREYSELLNRGFPRVPLPSDAQHFQNLVRLGYRLIDAHLPIISPPRVDGCDESWLVARGFPRYCGERAAVFVNERSRLDDVPESVWHWRMGGVAVLRRWLEKRRGRCLGETEREHFRWMVGAAQTTIELAARCGELVELSLDRVE